MHFYLLLRPFVSFLVFNAFITSTLGKLLPRVRTGSQSPIIYPVGAHVRIECPIYDDDNPDLLFFEWFDEKGDPIRETSRVKITDSGVLKIKSAIKDDTGLYICKGINGFGTETTTVMLQIVRQEDLQSLNSPLDNQYPFQYPQYDNLVLESDVNSDFSYKGTDSRPLVRNSEPKIIEKQVGIYVALSCNTRGRVKWYKNGRPLNLEELPSGSFKKRGVLNISKVRIEDSGNYSCVTINGWPQVNNTFTLIVYDKPELTGFHPINSSVLLGEKAVFHCKVRSEVKPFIQWLRSYKNEVDAEEAKRRGLIPINSEFYKVMNSTKIVKTHDGNYYKDLTIDKTKLSDSGNYICLAAYTNPGSFNFSFTYKSTYLTVLSPTIPTESPIRSETPSGLSISTIFWISCAVVSMIVAVLIAILNRLQKEYENRVNRALNNNSIERGDNIADKPRDYSNHYYFRPESSSPQSGYLSGVVYNTNGDNCSSDRLTYQT